MKADNSKQKILWVQMILFQDQRLSNWTKFGMYNFNAYEKETSGILDKTSTIFLH